MPTNPTLEPLNPRNAHPGKLLVFGVTVNNPDSVPFTFSLVQANPPDFPGATIDAAGKFSWTPSTTMPPRDPRTITVKITFAGPGEDTEPCEIAVIDQPPVLDTLPPRTGHPGATLTFNVNAVDPDFDPVSYAMVPDPNQPLPGASLDFSGKFTWAVPANQPLSSYTLTVKAKTANNESDTKTCTITLVNAPPVLDTLTPKTVQAGKILTFYANAVDPDWDALTYSLVPPPNGDLEGAIINSATGKVSWTVPLGFTPGTYTLTIKVTDPSGGSDTKTCTITVT